MAEPELLLSPLVGSSSLLYSPWVLIILLLMTPPFSLSCSTRMSILQCKHHGNSFIFSASLLPIPKSTMIIYSLDILSGLPKGTSAFSLACYPHFLNSHCSDILHYTIEIYYMQYRSDHVTLASASWSEPSIYFFKTHGWQFWTVYSNYGKKAWNVAFLRALR